MEEVTPDVTITLTALEEKDPAMGDRQHFLYLLAAVPDVFAAVTLRLRGRITEDIGPVSALQLAGDPPNTEKSALDVEGPMPSNQDEGMFTVGRVLTGAAAALIIGSAAAGIIYHHVGNRDRHAP